MAAFLPGLDIARDGRLLLPWVQYDLQSYNDVAGTTTFRMSDVPLALSEGYVEPVVLEWHRYARALSDDDGTFETSTFGWTIADVGRALMDLADDQYFRYWSSRFATLYLLDGPARTAGDTPYIVARAVVRHVQAQADRTLVFTAEDFLATEFSLSYLDEALPRRRMELARFAPTAPEATGWHPGVAGFPEPILYGTLSHAAYAADLRYGACPCYPVGAESIAGNPSWVRMLIAGHASKEVEALYIDGVVVDAARYGADVLCPGKTGWPFGTTYRDIGGRRYTVAYIIGADATALVTGEVAMSADVKGIETVGDGSGTLITAIYDQYLHWLTNFGLGDYQTGAWLSIPTWPDSTPRIESASFATAKASIAGRVSSAGYVGGGILGSNNDLRTLAEWLAAWNASCDARCGFTRLGQFRVCSGEQQAAALDVTEQDDIVAGSFTVTVAMEELRNVVPVSFAREYVADAWATSGRRAVSTVSVTGYRRRIEDHDRALWFVRDQATADDIATHFLHRKMHPPRRVAFATGLHGLLAELGSTVAVTHADAPGHRAYWVASPPAGTGWVQRPVLVERVEVSLGDGLVRLTGWDYEVLDPYPPAVSFEPGITPPGTSFSLGAGAGVGGGSGTMTVINNYYTGSGVTTIELGGSRESGIVSASYVAAPDYADKILPATSLSALTRFRCHQKTTDAGTSVRVRVVAVDAGGAVLQVCAESIASTNMGWGSGEAGHYVDVPFTPRAGTTAYRLQITGSNANTDVWVAGAHLTW